MRNLIPLIVAIAVIALAVPAFAQVCVPCNSGYVCTPSGCYSVASPSYSYAAPVTYAASYSTYAPSASYAAPVYTPPPMTVPATYAGSSVYPAAPRIPSTAPLPPPAKANRGRVLDAREYYPTVVRYYR